VYGFLRINHPRLDDADEGRFGAFIYGPYKRYKPIAITVGAVDTLAKAWVKDTNPTTIKLSTIALFERFTTSGKVQINRERFSYTNKNAGTLELTGVTPGVDLTSKENHDEGEGVYEVLPNIKYAVCENPRYVHFTEAILAVYINGRLKAASEAPTHTINLDDRTIVPGRSFVSITFDLTSIKAEEIREPIPIPPPRQVIVASSPPRSGIIGYAGSGGGGGSDGIYRVPPPPQTPRGPRVDESGIGTRTRLIKEFPVPVIGTVEVDIRGLKDDSIGTITGTPSARIERPAHVCRTQLREAWGRRDDAEYDFASFTATHALQLADGIRWSLAYEGEDFEAWKFSALLAGKAHLYDFAGKWFYTYRKRSAPTHEIDVDNDAWPDKDSPGPNFSFTPRTEIVTELPVVFDRDLDRRELLLRSLAGIARYGIQRNKRLDLEWIYDLPVARLLGAYWLGQWDRMRLGVVVSLPWRYVTLAPWDSFTIRVPLMTAYGVTQVTFHVLDLGVNADNTLFSLVGEEGDPLGVSLIGSWRVSLPKAFSLTGSWRFGPRVFPPLGGSVLPGLYPGGLAG